MTTLSEPAVESPAVPDVRSHLTSARTRTALRIQHEVLRASREYLCDNGFVELPAPVIGPVTDPGVRGAKQVDVDYYGHRYKLMTSAILYKQASLLAFDRIFYIAPNVRLEPVETASTQRHLVEFHQIDVEAAGMSRDDIMGVAEGLVTHVITRVLDGLDDNLAALGRDRAALARVRAPFGRLTHHAAIERVRDLGHVQSPDAEIEWRNEVVLSRAEEQPFFITDYPKGCRGFYDRERADRPGTLENFDLILPEGYGELCSGSVREHEYHTIVPRIRETGENPAKYEWYLRELRQGIPASAGFGIGLERLTRYLGGLDAVWQATAFPKLAGVKSP